jgi:hypothetical protein
MQESVKKYADEVRRSQAAVVKREYLRQIAWDRQLRPGVQPHYAW